MGDALGGELWRFLCFTSALKFQILEMLKKKRPAPIIKFRLVRHEVFRLVRHEGSEYRKWLEDHNGIMVKQFGNSRYMVSPVQA